MADKADNQKAPVKEVRASLGDLRIAPRKVRLVTDLLNGKSVKSARQQLQFLAKKSARPILKLINSAVANAQHNFQLDPEGLFIKSIVVHQGYTLKRFKPRAQGRAFPIRHHTSRVHVILEPRTAKQAKRKPKKSKPDSKAEK